MTHKPSIKLKIGSNNNNIDNNGNKALHVSHCKCCVFILALDKTKNYKLQDTYNMHTRIAERGAALNK